MTKKLGVLLALLCTGFVIQQLAMLDLNQVPLEDWRVLFRTVFVGGAVYGIISIVLSVAWQKLLHWSGEPRVTLKSCCAIYGRTQIAKYIPGNIFSIAGRHLLGKQNGINDGALFWSAALEILGMIFISGIVFAVGSSISSDLGLIVEIPIVLCAVLTPLMLPWLIKAGISKFPALKDYNVPKKSIFDYLRLYLVYFLYLPWLIGAAILLWWIAYDYTGESPPFLLVLGVFSGAWLAGYLVPGASGGIGIREALLIVGLKPLIGESIILVTILFRVGTIIGDIVFFVLSLLCSPRRPDPENSAVYAQRIGKEKT